MASPAPTDPAELVEELRRSYRALHEHMGHVVVGQEHVLKLLTTGLMCSGHMLMVGVPGLAKTLMVRGLGACLGWDFRRIQFTPDLMPSDITGTEILQQVEGSHERELVYHHGPIFANLVLADEINRTPPKTQAALLEAMQEHAVTVGGTTHQLPQPFVVVATQNPIEQEGTYPLPEAQLDRFLLSVHVDYPDRDHEYAIAARPARMRLPELQQVASPEIFLAFRDVIDQVPVSDPVLRYAVDLVRSSRPKEPEADEYVRTYISWGVGPRCAQHLVMAAKAAAILDGRPSPEIADVREMALPVLRHRIVPNYNALGEGLESPDLIAHLLENIREPAMA
ncbi:MAG: AAA family ATPase [Planctomycetota bacterium]